MGKAKPVLKMDAAGDVVDRYISAADAGKANGIDGKIISNRCLRATQETDGYQYRYEDGTQAGSRRTKQSTKATSTLDDQKLKEEDLRKSGIPGIQHNSALRLLKGGMDVLSVSNITGLGPEKLGYMLSRINQGQPMDR